MTGTSIRPSSATPAPVSRRTEPGAATGRPIVIWNPSAGGGTADDLAQRRATLERALADHGIQAELYQSASEDDTDRRVDRAIEEGHRPIVAAGGDGTVRSIAFKLLGTDVPLGILPLGTAMNVANSLGIPLDLDGASEVLAKGVERSIDVGEVRGRPFLEIAALGLGAEVLQKATHVGEGRLHAAVELLRTTLRSRRTRVRLQLDGREVRSRALMIAVANGMYTGRAIGLAPKARLDDGKFDVLLYEGFGAASLAAHLARVLLGRPRDERIRHYRAATVRISTHRPLPVRVDSHDLGATPVELVTRPNALMVVAAPSASAPGVAESSRVG